MSQPVQKKQEKKVQIGKKEEKLSLCIEDNFFVEYPKKFAHTLVHMCDQSLPNISHKFCYI